MPYYADITMLDNSIGWGPSTIYGDLIMRDNSNLYSEVAVTGNCDLYDNSVGSSNSIGGTLTLHSNSCSFIGNANLIKANIPMEISAISTLLNLPWPINIQ